MSYSFVLPPSCIGFWFEIAHLLICAVLMCLCAHLLLFQAVMADAERENDVLLKVLSMRLKLELAQAEGLADVAIAAGLGDAYAPGSGLSKSGGGGGAASGGNTSTAAGGNASHHAWLPGSAPNTAVDANKKDPVSDPERARIAVAAAAASSACDLAPGRVLALLGAEQAAEALRRRRVAVACRDALLADRLEPMRRDFSDVIAGTARAGEDVVASGRRSHDAVRSTFEAYDRAARLLLKACHAPLSDPARALLTRCAEAQAVEVAAVQAQAKRAAANAAAQAAALPAAMAGTAASGGDGSGDKQHAPRAVEVRRAANAAAAAEAQRIAAALAATVDDAGTRGHDKNSVGSMSAAVQDEAAAFGHPLQDDAWLCALQWRLAAAHQNSLWRETTKRLRLKYEALHKAEHNRRVVWARALEAWKVGVVRSQTNETGSGLLAPFSDALGHQVGAAAASPQRTHGELMAAIRKRVPIGLTDLADRMNAPPSDRTGSHRQDLRQQQQQGQHQQLDSKPEGGGSRENNGHSSGSGGGEGTTDSAAAAKAAAAKALADKTAALAQTASGNKNNNSDSSDTTRDASSIEAAALEAPDGADIAAALDVLGATGAEAQPSQPTGVVGKGDSGMKVITGGKLGAPPTHTANNDNNVPNDRGSENTGLPSTGSAEDLSSPTVVAKRGGVLEGGGWPLAPGHHAGLLAGNPLVVKFALLELHTHGLVMSSWAHVVAVLTVQGHLLLLPVPKQALSAAARRYAAAHPNASSSNSSSSNSLSSLGFHTSSQASSAALPPPSWAFAEALALLDPVSPPVAPGATRAAEVAAQARAAAASRAGPMPTLQSPAVVPSAALVLAACAVEWAPKASACGCAFEVTEHFGSDRHNSGSSSGLSWNNLLPAAWGQSKGQTVELKATSQAECFEWIFVLRRLSRSYSYS